MKLPFDIGSSSLSMPGITTNIPAGLVTPFSDAVVKILFQCGSPAKLRTIINEALSSAPDDTGRFLLLGFATAAFHELKHFHDLLASPFGAGVMANQVLASRYVLPTIRSLAGEATIGIPLHAWMGLSDDLHKILIRQVRSQQFSRRPPELTCDLTENCRNILNRITNLFGAPAPGWGFGIETRHLLEYCAVEMQKEGLRNLLGNEAAEFFGSQLEKVESQDRPYTGMSSIWTLFSDSELSLTIKNAIQFFTLCGPTWDPKADRDAVHPIRRLNCAMEYVRDSNWTPSDHTVLPMLDGCAKEMGLPTLEKSLMESVAFSRRWASALPELLRSDSEFAGADAGTLAEAYGRWVEAHARMVSEILKEPLAFFTPLEYARNVDRWVAAPNWLTTTTRFFGPRNKYVDLQKLRSVGWTPVQGFSDQDGEPVWTTILLPNLTAGAAILSSHAAGVLYQWSTMSHLLWTDDRLAPESEEYMGALLRTSLPAEFIHLGPTTEGVPEGYPYGAYWPPEAD
jgi:hypothetical protein